MELLPAHPYWIPRRLVDEESHIHSASIKKLSWYKPAPSGEVCAPVVTMAGVSPEPWLMSICQTTPRPSWIFPAARMMNGIASRERGGNGIAVSIGYSGLGTVRSTVAPLEYLNCV